LLQFPSHAKSPMASDDATERLDRLLDEAWARHDTDSDRLARELEAAVDAGATPTDPAAFLHLATHTIGEHLGDWPRAFRLGARLLSGRTATPETARAWGRWHVAAVLAGETAAAADAERAYLDAEGDDRDAAVVDLRLMLATALVGAKRAGEAGDLYRDTLALADQVRPSARLDRTLAVASNNLGWELYENPSRTAEDDALMRLCAATALAFWRRCGDWINEERALYLRALTAIATGEAQSGLDDANKALAIIASHGERPLDTALLHLARARALAVLGDAGAASWAVGEADMAASRLPAASLKAQFDQERSKVVSAWA
jgi:hypothetical protein